MIIPAKAKALIKFFVLIYLLNIWEEQYQIRSCLKSSRDVREDCENWSTENNSLFNKQLNAVGMAARLSASNLLPDIQEKMRQGSNPVVSVR